MSGGGGGVRRSSRQKQGTPPKRKNVRASPRLASGAHHQVSFSPAVFASEGPTRRGSPRKESLSIPSPRQNQQQQQQKDSVKSVPILPVVRGKAIKLILEQREDLELLPQGYEHGHQYGGRLLEEQASIKLSTPLVKDRRRFQASQIEAPESYVDGHHVTGKKSPEIKCLHLGVSGSITPWYSAPFPAEYYTREGHLWMCEWCLKYFRSQRSMRRHIRKCCGRPPPGNEIYRAGHLSVFEVNGRTAKSYCQNLCLLAKMFLDHKTLYYDVETFLFYILVEWHPIETLKAPKKRHASFCTYNLVGYFSKEKLSQVNNNVSCILTLPNHQRKGYGYFLIDFSYLLSKTEGKRCSPEKPLSDLGLVSYVSYWSQRVFQSLDGLPRTTRLTIEAICDATGMTINDVLAVFEYHGFVKWSPQQDGHYTIQVDEEELARYREKRAARKVLEADPAALRWSPFTCTR